jgi:DNA-binding IclR family transcriptional regulator
LSLAKISGVLDMLSDGEWHGLEEVRKEMGLSRSQVRQIMGFLKQYEFVTFDEAKKKVRLEEATKEFLTRMATP